MGNRISPLSIKSSVVEHRGTLHPGARYRANAIWRCIVSATMKHAGGYSQQQGFAKSREHIPHRDRGPKLPYQISLILCQRNLVLVMKGHDETNTAFFVPVKLVAH